MSRPQAENLYRKATGEGREAATAAIFWLKTRGGWRETPKDHNVGLFDMIKVSDEDLKRTIGMLSASIADQSGQK